MQTLADKRHAVELLEQLDSSQLAAVVQLLEVMVPHDEDGDTLSHAERKAIAEATSGSSTMSQSRTSKCSPSSA